MERGGRGRKRAVKEWKEIRAIEIQPSSRFPGTCTSGNSPTAKWICDKVTLERTRNSDKETSFPSVPLSLFLFLSRSHLGRAIPTREEDRGRGKDDGGGWRTEGKKARLEKQRLGKKERDSRGQCPSNGRPRLLLYPGETR